MNSALQKVFVKLTLANNRHPRALLLNAGSILRLLKIMRYIYLREELFYSSTSN